MASALASHQLTVVFHGIGGSATSIRLSGKSNESKMKI